MSAFYVVVGIAMMFAAVAWFVSPRSRYKIKRLALLGLVIAVVLAIAWRYSQEDMSLDAPEITHLGLAWQLATA
ncbi:MAG: hypothetical protein ACRDXX_01275 [Stackebrandtia sp.]